MTQESDKQQRRSIRLPGYDYAQAGGYFVTIVTRDRECLFGEVIEGKMRPNEFGCIVQAAWSELPDHYQGVQCDVFVVMPNHVHGIIVLVERGAVEESDVGAGLKPALPNFRPATTPRAGFKPAPTLTQIIRAFKTFSARRINELRTTPGLPVWQRNYYEHVVRGENELNGIREYIANNPVQWEMDRENPLRTSNESRRKAEAWQV
jgi:REP element-mobilizing transposase RayT